jgi:hypothetical protein
LLHGLSVPLDQSFTSFFCQKNRTGFGLLVRSQLLPVILFEKFSSISVKCWQSSEALPADLLLEGEVETRFLIMLLSKRKHAFSLNIFYSSFCTHSMLDPLLNLFFIFASERCHLFQVWLGRMRRPRRSNSLPQLGSKTAQVAQSLRSSGASSHVGAVRLLRTPFYVARCSPHPNKTTSPDLRFLSMEFSRRGPATGGAGDAHRFPDPPPAHGTETPSLLSSISLAGDLFSFSFLGFGCVAIVVITCQEL